MKLYISGILLFLASALFAQAPPVVENVRFEQRTDGSLIVDIYYDLIGPADTPHMIVVEASGDNGQTWDLHCESILGDQGEHITPGQGKHVVWDFFEDNPWVSGDDYRVRVTAYKIQEGLFISKDTTLVEDIEIHPGTPWAITINASNVTLDLGGHTISGYVLGGFAGGVAAENFDNITIKNGTIDGFLVGVSLGNCDCVTIENLTIRNLDIANPDIFVVGIGLGQSKGSIIRDIYFEFLPVAHKEAIILNITDAEVTDIEMHGGSVGVNFGGACGPDSKGSLRNSKFYDLNMNAALVQCGNGVEITDNVIIRNEAGIRTEAANSMAINNILIKGNEIRDGATGIAFDGTNNSVITDNVILNSQWGIAINPSTACFFEEPGHECFHSTGNVISDNVVVGNIIDLSHHENCLGNTWENNIYETKEGAEIPASTHDISTTAGELLTSIDSAASVIATDAKLLMLYSMKCDTTGNSYRWVYVFRSENQQKDYEFWLLGDQIITMDAVTKPFDISEDNLPIPETWIDSDSAIVVADGLGGKEFRETFEIQTIKMDLINTWGLHWNVYYISPDSTFSTYFDASM